MISLLFAAGISGITALSIADGATLATTGAGTVAFS